ncbi:glutamate carboxypeptidase [Phenylobacterium immobile]|uniref:glutamate carboxypeptidase n=1 Tax=Phenylobacterium immobile TaxID=21 RepID=UPI000A4B962E|nr:glutamate carboxypeptidase [Phenylobacterium immobile]
MTGRGLIASSLALVLVASAAIAASPPRRDARVWSAAQQARTGQLALLEKAVNIDSGTGDVDGGAKVIALLRPELEALGMTVRTEKAEAEGLADNVVATLKGTGKGRILMIGHLDTVFEVGAAAKRPYRTDAARAYGPGVGDEKGGVIEAIYALKILRDLGFTNYAQITLLIESSEERGSPGTRKLIDQLLKDADVELNLEPGDPPDLITVWRKGSATYFIDVKGRPAHAGVAPQDGRNAATELLHQLEGAEGFPKTGDQLTVNLTILNAGSRVNIIPEDASAGLNARGRTKAQLQSVEDKLNENAKITAVPDTKVTIRQLAAFPPLADNPDTAALAERAKAIYAGIGMTLGAGGNGGASESALAYEAGVPAIDGLGPVGGKFHSEEEYIELGSVTPRLYLLTKLIMELGPNPPKPASVR